MYDSGQKYAQSTKLNPASECAQTLIQKVEEINEDGTTALGPSVAYALGMASSCPGSKILICTDGQANLGFGSISQNTTNAKDQYQLMGTTAKENGTTCNVLSIKGEDCALENLGILSDLTFGVVDIVEPTQLKNTVANILSKPVLATGLTCRVICDRRFKFARSQTFVDNQEIGNVNQDIDLTFSFSPIEIFDADELYFQTQLSYSKPNGAQVKRVITQKKRVTRDRDVSERNITTFVLAMKAVQESAEIAQYNEFQDARINLISYQRLFQRGMKKQKRSKRIYQFYCPSREIGCFYETSSGSTTTY